VGGARAWTFRPKVAAVSSTANRQRKIFVFAAGNFPGFPPWMNWDFLDSIPTTFFSLFAIGNKTSAQFVTLLRIPRQPARRSSFTG
jgi:hypothetical protein